MLRDCLISGFADEINRDFGVQLKTLQELGQKYIELRAADGIGVADMTTEQAKGFHDRMSAAGIRVSAIGSPIGKIGITDDFEPHFEKFRHVVELAHEEGLDSKIIIGGAVVTQDYADEIHADGYAKDAADTVRLAKRLLGLNEETQGDSHGNE